MSERKFVKPASLLQKHSVEWSNKLARFDPRWFASYGLEPLAQSQRAGKSQGYGCEARLFLRTAELADPIRQVFVWCVKAVDR